MEILKNFPSDEYIELLQKRSRLNLTTESKKKMIKALQGSYGEQLFKELAEESADHCIGFFDLKFEVVGKEFQIDACFIMQDELYVFEIKWLNHDVILSGGLFYFSDTNEEIITINQQSSRTQALFKKFLDVHQLTYRFHYYHVFINKDKKVFGITRDDYCLHHHDVKHFLKEKSQIPLFYDHQRLCNTFLHNTLLRSKYVQPIELNFDQAKKGIMCECHKDFLSKKTQRIYNCPCGKIYSSHQALEKSIKDYIILFPSRSIDVFSIHTWSDSLFSYRSIRRYLSSHMKKVGTTKSTSYIPK